MKKFLLLVCVLGLQCQFLSAQTNRPFRIAIDGLTHDHVNGLFNRVSQGDLEIVGIAEPNRDLAMRYLAKFHLPVSLWYSSINELLEKVKPEAVCAFNSIASHIFTVRACVPRGIPVMVEKPLATRLADAIEIDSLARRYQVPVLTNYETTWYASHGLAYSLLDSVGPLRKIVVHDGHAGPREIGVSSEFFDWLTDPVKNGGGALIDFGCYGANLITWLMKGERPVSVTAITQQIKPEIYPKVDDEATIVVTYPHSQGIIQASWNWPFGRKDIEIYGRTGWMMADREGLKLKSSPADTRSYPSANKTVSAQNDPFAYLAAVVRGQVALLPGDLSSLANNLVVVAILDAARQSAAEGRTIYLPR